MEQPRPGPSRGLIRPKRRRAQRLRESPSGLGLYLLLVEDGPIMYRNGLRNYAEGRIGLIQGVAVRAERDAIEFTRTDVDEAMTL